MKSYCIAITGLPGCGKTTVGREVAVRLALPFLDKDTFLEQLFDERGVGDVEWRQRLSLASNHLFRGEAEAQRRVVLASHWRPPGLDGPSGTPTEWLSKHYDRVVELYCLCPVEVASRRFTTRSRHAGHLDGRRTPEEVEAWMRRYERHLPLGIGTQVRISMGVHPDRVAVMVREAIGIEA